MSHARKKLDQQLRRQLVRKVIIALIVMIVFVGFMSYALYREYGPGTEVVDYFGQ